MYIPASRGSGDVPRYRSRLPATSAWRQDGDPGLPRTRYRLPIDTTDVIRVIEVHHLSPCPWLAPNARKIQLHISSCGSPAGALSLIGARSTTTFTTLVGTKTVLANANIRTELPTCTSFLPKLSLEGEMIKIAEPKVREKCLEGYTFVLGSLDKYTFGDRFQSLLEVVNAKFIHADEFCSSSQFSVDGEDTTFVLVIPGGSQNEINYNGKLSSLSRVIDMKIVAAILSGHLDSTNIHPSSIIVSSSHSTDETIVADSDLEVDTVTSNLVAATDKPEQAVKYECEGKNANDSEHENDTRKCDKNNDYSNNSLIETRNKGTTVEELVTMKRLDKGDESVVDRHENSDIIFSQALIVRETNISVPVHSTLKKVVNFKCFRKRETQSGNSFRNLIPFSNDPYKESDGGSKESAEYMREEKKRKQLEAIAEDLFNSEKGRKHASSATSIQALLARR